MKICTLGECTTYNPCHNILEHHNVLFQYRSDLPQVKKKIDISYNKTDIQDPLQGAKQRKALDPRKLRIFRKISNQGGNINCGNSSSQKT